MMAQSIRLALCVLGFSMGGAFAQGCPPNSHPDSENATTVFCVCNEGFAKRDGACQPVMTVGPGPQQHQTTMRAITRPECVRFAGEQLKKDLETCRSPVMSCLTTEGVTPAAAACTLTTLTSGVAFAASAVADPTKASTAVAAMSLAAALSSCRVTAKNIAQACAPAAGTCQEQPLKAHKDAVAACPAN
jgi:hypothetical protein